MKSIITSIVVTLVIATAGCVTDEGSEAGTSAGAGGQSAGGSAGAMGGSAGSTAGAGAGSAGSAGSAAAQCSIETYQLIQADTVDITLKVPALACPRSFGHQRMYAGVNVYGDDFCLGETDYPEGSTPECSSNADCEAGSLCFCPFALVDTGFAFNIQFPARCLPAPCSSPDDCGGRECGLAADGFSQNVGTACHTENDECQSDSDCERLRLCTLVGDRWACVNRLGG